MQHQAHRNRSQIPTLDEYITVALDAGVGIYPETKHPTWHDALPFMAGATFSDLVLDALVARGYGGAVGSPGWAARPAFIQSFEVRRCRPWPFRCCSTAAMQRVGRPARSSFCVRAPRLPRR